MTFQGLTKPHQGRVVKGRLRDLQWSMAVVREMKGWKLAAVTEIGLFGIFNSMSMKLFQGWRSLHHRFIY